MSLPYRLKPTDYFDNTIAASDGTYLYQFDSNSLNRIPLNDRGTPEDVILYSAMPETPDTTTLKILSTGTMLAVGASQMVMRSTDSGESWVDTGTTLDHAVSGWGRSIAEITVNGAKRVYIGEYNTAGSGTVKLYESTTDGASFTVINTWTYNSGAQHLHCVLADPFNPTHLYLGFGDADAFTGIIKWDSSVGDWSGIGDQTPSDIVATPVSGFTAVGDTSIASQRYRVTDIMFTENALYSFADSSTSVDNIGVQGIWKFDRNLENWVNILPPDLQDDLIAYTELSGLAGLVVEDQVLFVAYVSGSAGTDNELPIYATRDGENVKKVGVFHTQDIAAPKNIRSLFNVGSEVFLSVSPEGGKTEQKGSCAFEITTETFKGPEPDIVHPVFWVDPTGDNANSGDNPREPFLEFFYPISTTIPGKIPWGTCVMIGANNYTSAAITYGGWNGFAGTYATEAGKKIQIRGEGKGSTQVDINTGSAGLTQSATFAATPTLHLSDMELLYSGTTTGYILAGQTAQYGKILATDCKLGDIAVGIKGVGFLRDTLIQAYRCDIENEVSASATDYYWFRVEETTPGTECKAQAYACIFHGSQYGNRTDNNGEIETYNCVLKNARNAALITFAGTVNQPVSIGCVYHGTDANWAPLDDDNTMTYEKIDYCIFDKSSSTDGVTDAELGANSVIDANVAVAADVFVDPANDDYTPIETNIAFQAGGGRPVHMTYSGAFFNSPASVGCDDIEKITRVRPGTRTR